MIAGITVMMGLAGGVAFLLVSPGEDLKPRELEPPRRVSVPPPQAPLPRVASPTPTAEPSPPPPPPTAASPSPLSEPRKPQVPQTNEAWGAQRLAKNLKKYDFCGKEAILRKKDVPRRYTLHARFGADGQGTWARIEPAPLNMMNPCVDNATRYVFLGKPPQAREFEVKLPLSFAHLRPTGKPETNNDQWHVPED